MRAGQAVDGGFCWVFEGVHVQGNVLLTEEDAAAELSAIRKELYPVWRDTSKKDAYLKQLMQRLSKRKEVETMVRGRTLAFASPLFAVCPSHADKARGFLNLGNTCYINSVVQCLFHCAPFRHDIELQPVGASFVGDCLKNLWTTYKAESASQLDLQPPLLALVRQILRHTGFAGGIQQDAAECLMHLLQSVDGGRMQQRVCGAYAVASQENMILCRTTAEAHVS